MSTYTPGPWRVMGHAPYTVNYDGPDHNWLIATMNPTVHIGAARWNAWLIAKAPRLVDALRDLLEVAEMAVEDEAVDFARALLDEIDEEATP